MLTEKPTASLNLGLDIDGMEIRAVQIKSGKGRLTLENILCIPVELDPPHHVKPLYIGTTEKQFNSLLNKSLIVTGMTASDVMVRDLTVQLVKEKDIDQILEFQSEPLLPFSIEDAVVDRIVSGKGLDHTDLTICAVKKDSLSEHISLWHEAGVEPEVVSSSQAALSAFSKVFSPVEGLHYLLHLGYEETICLLINDGILLNAQIVRIGIKDLEEAFHEDTKLSDKQFEEAFKNSDLSSITSESHPKLHQKIKNLSIESTKCFFALAKQYPAHEIEDILITGNSAALINFPEKVTQQLNKKLHYPKKVKGFELTNQELQRWAIPIGLALQTVPGSNYQINFRQKEYTYPYPWKRIKKPMAIYITLCLLLSAAILFFGNAYISHKEDALRKEYLAILELMNKPFNEMEAEIKKKNPYIRTFEDGSGTPLRNMSQSDIAYRIQLIENEIKETPDTFPLLPNTPNVSDFLAWLSNHPHIKSSEEKNNNRNISLESLSYKMVKRPDANKKREKYQVKVELEFTTSTPRYAREFHDILLAPNEMVDPREDVKWNAERGRYRASFFLKDRTTYPTGKRK